MRVLQVVYTRGLGHTLDLSVGARYDWTRAPSINGGAASIGLKWRTYEDKARGISWAVKPEVRLPVATEHLGARVGDQASSGGVTIIVTPELSFGALHFNVGASAERYRDPAANPTTIIAQVSVAPVWNIGRSWRFL